MRGREGGPGRPPRRGEWGLRLGRGLAVAILVFLSLYTLSRNSVVVDGSRIFWLDDDQMISMRYGRNLADGHGLVWNPGERVEGYTNFLWTLVMAGVHLLPLDDDWTAVPVVLVNLVLALLVLWLAERLLRVLAPETTSPDDGSARRWPRRLRRLTRPRTWAVPILWITLALCMDLVYWSANGFEVTLLTVLFLAVVVRFLEEPGTAGPGAYLLLGLLALVRSDALVVWVAAAIVGLGAAWIGKGERRGERANEGREEQGAEGLDEGFGEEGGGREVGEPDRRSRLVRTSAGLAASLVLPAAHVLFRLFYYGSLLPNTYYLKVAGLAAPWSQGLGYVQAFVGSYAAPLALAVLGVPLSGDRRRWLLLGALGWNAVYVVRVGGDIFHHARFLAHFVPVILALGIAGVLDLGRRMEADPGDRSAAGLGSPARLLLLVVVSVSVLLQAGVHPLDVLVPVNGDPRSGAIAGLAIREHTGADATVAVVAAGNVPYFSRRRAVDLLGKNDPHVARQPPRCCPGALGHNKFDPDYSFGLEPDLVVLLWPHSLVARYVEGLAPGGVSLRAPADAGSREVPEGPAAADDLAGVRKFWRGPAFARSRPFREHYFPNPVPVPALLQWDGIYVRSDSPEIDGLDDWQAPRVVPF